MFALYKKDIVRNAIADDYLYGYDSEQVSDMVMEYDGDYNHRAIIDLYHDINSARKEFNKRGVNTFITNGGLLVARIYWIEEVETDDDNNVTDYLGTWNYKAAPLYPTIGASDEFEE